MGVKKVGEVKRECDQAHKPFISLFNSFFLNIFSCFIQMGTGLLLFFFFLLPIGFYFYRIHNSKWNPWSMSILIFSRHFHINFTKDFSNWHSHQLCVRLLVSAPLSTLDPVALNRQSEVKKLSCFTCISMLQMELLIFSSVSL